MNYLLDTNACIGYLNGRALGVMRKLRSIPPSAVALCSVVKAELLYGAWKSADPARARSKLDSFFSAFVSLPFDDAAAGVYGQVRAQLARTGSPIGPNDLMIASIARTHGLVLVTHNVREFQRVPGLSIEDWEARSTHEEP